MLREEGDEQCGRLVDRAVREADAIRIDDPRGGAFRAALHATPRIFTRHRESSRDTANLHDRRVQCAAEDSTFELSDDDAYVFAKPDGKPTHPHLMSDGFKRLVKRSGLPRIRLHDLRHTHATLMLKEGVPIKVVSERLGYSMPAFTMATYHHVLPGMQAEAAKTFPRLLEPLPAATR